MTTPPVPPLLTVRAALILMSAIFAGVLAGILAYLSQPSVPAAVLWGGGAAGGALALFHSVIGRS